MLEEIKDKLLTLKTSTNKYNLSLLVTGSITESELKKNYQ